MKNELTYLSISKEPYSINYAVFKGKTLNDYGVVELKQMLYTGNIILEVHKAIIDLIEKYKPTMITSQLIDEKKHTKHELRKIITNQTIIEYVCLTNDVLYVEFQTYGWEKRILNNVLTPNQKVKVINSGYNLSLKKEQSSIADAIILGEGVAHNRLQIGRTLNDY